MGLKTYIVKRIGYMIVLLFLVITLNFFIFMLMPGDPTTLFVNPMKFKKEEIEALRNMWGLNDPLHVRYLKYVWNLLTWNFGHSIHTGLSIYDEISWRLPYTILLIGGSTVLSMIIGILIGVIVAYKRGTWIDTLNVSFALTVYSLPVFWMGLVFLIIFASYLHWFPLAGAFPREWLLPGKWPPPLATFNFLGINISIPSWTEIFERIRHAFLPIFTLTLFQYGGWLLLTRATMIEALTEDYILTAKAKGVKTRNLLLKHALKNASLPLITNAALSFGFMFTGAIITETVYTWPGMGTFIWTAIAQLDYPVLQAVFFIIALCVIIANFIADLAYGVVDPRIKYE
ncbi:MAG: ABC transporter permease [Candidatus Bathyarchaeia archaeon]